MLILCEGMALTNASYLRLRRSPRLQPRGNVYRNQWFFKVEVLPKENQIRYYNNCTIFLFSPPQARKRLYFLVITADLTMVFTI